MSQHKKTVPSKKKSVRRTGKKKYDDKLRKSLHAKRRQTETNVCVCVCLLK